MINRVGRYLLWCVLAVPAVLMLTRLATGSALVMDLLHPSGEMAIRLMILAMLPGPLADAFRGNRVLRRWLAIRRNLGVAAFAYALVHLALYVVDMGSLPALLGELPLPGIWTGWLALGLMVPPAAISFDAAMRALGRRWKTVQRLVYPALLIALLHWALLERDWLPAIIHLAPLAIAWALRVGAGYRKVKLARSMP
ncbi:ferric reductase-like transmembrane domain-containing protein [Parapedomonas caeni]|jgi:sulfoxide reductase heme-binding subunit YedZ